MNTGGQVSVELKLMMDSLRRQIKEAGEIIKDGLSKTNTTIAPEIDKAGKATDALTDKTKKATDEAMNLQKAWKDVIDATKNATSGGGKTEPSKPSNGPQPPPLPGRPPKSIREWLEEQNANKSAGGKFDPETGGFLPPTGGGGGGGAGAGATGAGAAGGAGGGGSAVAAAGGPVGIALLVVAGTMIVMAKAAKLLTDQMRKASDEAARLYAKALQNGAGMGYTAAADAFSNAIGVSEADVFRYGDAINYLNERMGDSIRTVAKVTPNLTSVNWEFQALWYRVKAVSFLFANELAGTFRTVINAINRTVQVLTPFIQALGKLINLMLKTSVVYMVSSLIGKDGGAAGPPTSSYNRLADSAWERMGFVVGQSSQNHAAATAANTKRIASLMEKLVSRFPEPQSHEGRTYALPQTP